MSAPPRLWLVRHAQPLVAPGICYGRLDLPADAGATAAAAHALAQALPARVAAVRHSPLQRCELLALSLQGLRVDLTTEPDPRLQELDFGAWEGQTWDAIGAQAVGRWSADLLHHAPGGGETLAAMLARVRAAWQEDAERAHALGADVVWISHAGVARCVQWLATQGDRMPQAGQWTLPAPACGAWLCLPLTGQHSGLHGGLRG